MLGVFPDDLFQSGQIPGVVDQPGAHAGSEAALDAQRVLGLPQRQVCAYGTLRLRRKNAPTNGGLCVGVMYVEMVKLLSHSKTKQTYLY